MMAGNDSDWEIDDVMANKALHQECRDALNNPKTMMSEPGWFQAGLMSSPRGWLPESGAVQNVQATNTERGGFLCRL